MAKFRKKPVVIEATQWFAGVQVEGVKIEPAFPYANGETAYPSGDMYYVTTIHGQRAYLAEVDWVITEPDGIHHYPCKPDIFEAIYESAN